MVSEYRPDTPHFERLAPAEQLRRSEAFLTADCAVPNITKKSLDEIIVRV
jgi:hypothetical protein